MMIVGISGKRRTGKSLLASMLEARYGYIQLSFAKVLKQEVREIFGLTEDHTDGPLKEIPLWHGGPSPRDVMIRYGQQIRKIDPNHWINRLKEQILSTSQAQIQTYVISDVRFINEADWIKRYNGLLVRLDRDEYLTGENINDLSETGLDYYKGFDLAIPKEQNADVNDLKLVAERVESLCKSSCERWSSFFIS